MDTVVSALALAVVLGVVAVVLRLLAAGLGVRVPRWVLVSGVLLPLGFLLPWILGPRLLASTDFLTLGQVPGVSAVEDAGRYQLINDPVLQFLPWELELRSRWSRGELALWSDSLEGGTSLWTNPQAQVLSPVALIARGFPIEWFFLVKMALQSLVCLLGVAVLCRRLGVSWTCGTLAGAAAALGGGLVPWSLFPHTGAAAWVPWTTAALVVLMRAPGRRSMATGGLLIGFLLLSGHPEVAFAGGCLGALAGLFLRSRVRPLLPRVAAVAVATILGVCIAAPTLLPFLASLGDSQRAVEMSHDRSVDLSTMEWSPATWFESKVRRVGLAALHPYAFGAPFRDEFSGSLNWLEAGAGYAGLWALAGGVLVLGLGLRRGLPFLLFAGLALSAASGLLPLVALLRLLPGFSVMAYPRLLLVGSIALCVAAAVSFSELRRRSPSALAWAALVVVAAASVAVGGREMLFYSLACWGLLALAVHRGEPGRPPVSVVPDARRVLASGRLRWLAPQLAVVVAAQVPWAWQMLPSSRPSSFFPASEVFDTLAAAAESGTARAGERRILGTDHLAYPSLLSVYGFHQTRPHNPMAPVGQLRVLEAAFGFSPGSEEYFSAVDRLNGAWLDYLAVGAVLTSTQSAVDGEELQPVGLEEAESVGPYRILRNPDAGDPWRAVTRWEVVDEARQDDWLRAFSDADTVSLRRAPPPGFHHLAGVSSFPRLRLLELRSGRLRWQVDAGGGFLLATSFPGPAGWTAHGRGEDGSWRPLESVAVHGAFFGCWVPPEITEVRMGYRPPGWLLGAVLGLFAGSLIGLLLTRRGWRPSAPRPRMAGSVETPGAASWRSSGTT